MDDETAFLRSILHKSGDDAPRLVYADWLDERGDPRAEFARFDPSLERINYVDWLGEGIEYYLLNFPEVQPEAEARKATEDLRNRRKTLGSTLDPNWVAFINTLSCPFEPFFFFNNGGRLREFRADELPFAESIGTRGSIVTFESDFRDANAFDQSLMGELGFLTHLKLGECSSGAASCPLHPFICELKSKRRPLTAKAVLSTLRADRFRSSHIPNLNSTQIAYPGYQPGDGHGVDNDEIHNDFVGQFIFQTSNEEGGGVFDESSGSHGELKQFVADGKLWYVLLHATPEKVDEFLFSRYVLLFAVGMSANGRRLIGVVTHQVCHNLCD